MRTKEVWAVGLAIAASFQGSAGASDSEAQELPALGAGISIPALIAAGAAAAAALAGRGGSAEASGESSPPRTRSYDSPADFQTSEFGAQQGLRMVRADTLYYNGHERWYVCQAANPAAGTGIGVRSPSPTPGSTRGRREPAAPSRSMSRPATTTWVTGPARPRTITGTART